MQEGHKKGGLFLFFCLGFIAGVGFYPLINNLFYIITACSVVIATQVVLIIFRKRLVFKLVSLILFILGFLLGAIRYDLNIHHATPNDIDYYLNQKVEVIGSIISVPTSKGKNQTIDFKVTNFINDQKVSGIIRANINLFPKYSYGDKLILTCKLQLPDNTTFNYQRYLARYKIYALCFNAKAKKLGEEGNGLRKYLFKLRNSIFEIITAHVNEPEASLVGPVMFGGGNEVDDDLVEIFRRTGLTHIMAVSGFNVSILAVIIGYVFFTFGLRRKVVFFITSFITFMYVVLVGAPASAVRAGIMSLMMLYALAIGRIAKIIHIIVIVGATTLVVNPLLLSADIGWQLSFLALLGLIYLQPILSKFFALIFLKKFKTFTEILSATIAAQLATTPITLFNFGQVSIISPIANMLVVWLIPVFTIVSLIALPITALFPALGDLAFLPSFFIAKYVIFVVNILSQPAWAVLTIL